MKKYRRLLWGILFILALAGCGREGAQSPDPDTEGDSQYAAETVQAEEPERQAGPVRENINLYGSFQGIYGCAVIYDPQEQRYFFYNEALAEQETSPYSTFKIISALEGLKAHVIENEGSTMDYSGEQYPVSVWNKNLTFEEAFQSSCVWYFRQVVDAVGEERMEAALRALPYGNCDISQWEGSGVNGMQELNGFWIGSSLEISPLEQVQVLAKIFEGQSDYSEQSISILKNLMLTDDNGTRKIYGKTGSDAQGKAWFVGFSEEEDQRSYFAVYLDDGNKKEQVSGNRAREIALDIFSSDGEPSAGADDTEIYRAFVEKSYPYGITSTLLEDLTGDGRQELIVVNNHVGGMLSEDTDEARALRQREKEEAQRNTYRIRNTAAEYPKGPAYAGMDYVGGESVVSIAVYGIKDDRVAMLYEAEAANTHAGWNWLYLYREGGKTYLFRYLPVMYQGMGTYAYDIFSLTEAGEEVRLSSGEEDVDMAGGGASGELQERMTAFLEQVHTYQKSSIPLVELGEDYFDTEKGSDAVRVYNYVIDHDELGIRR